MFTLNSYSISETNWKPVKFNTIGDQFELTNIPLIGNNGMSFIGYDFLTNITDFSFNNKTGIFLTNLYNNTDILIDKDQPKEISELKEIKTLILDNNGFPYKHYSIYNVLSGLQAVNDYPVIQDQITFYFEDSYVYVEDYYGKVLTNAGYGDSQLYFDLKTEPLNNNQKWNYIFNDNIIVLFAYDSQYSDIVLKNNYDRLELKKIETDQSSIIPSQSFITMVSYFDQQKVYNSVSDSFRVKYDSNPILKEDKLVTYKLPLTGRTQNYLGMLPYLSLKDDGSCDFYFHSLKNYQTSEYYYGTKLNERVYYKIHSGTNQDKGLDKIYLTYQTDTITLNFKPNKKTDFYFTPTGSDISLEDSGLKECGASGGEFPYISDRIFIDNESKFAAIPQLKDILKQPFEGETKFLCSWLYGSKTGGFIWYDRYYNSAVYSLDEALSASFMSYDSSLFGDVRYIKTIDIPSTVKLVPGVLYQYYHVGNEDSTKFLEYLNYKYSTDNIYGNVLNITSWEFPELKDKSYYNNNGLMFGNSSYSDENYWNMDGTNYAIFQANDSLLQTSNFTVSIWLKFEDWTDINAYQIFGNYYNSGFGLINDTKSIVPLFTVTNNDTQTIYNYNYNFTEASKTKTSLNKVDIIQRLDDLSYWACDSNECLAIKYDINNSIIVGPIKLNGLTHIDQIEIDSKENLYFYDNKIKLYGTFDKNGKSYRISAVSENSNRLEIDLYDNVLDGFSGKRTVYGNCSVVDNNNDLWQVIGYNLYKNKNIMGCVGASNQITCDIYNNIWILSDDNYYTKIDSEGNFVFRYSFKKIPLLEDTNCPPSPPLEPPKLKVLDEDLPFLSTNDYRYILTLPEYYQILVTPPEEKPIPIEPPLNKRIRVVDFVNYPDNKTDENFLSICGPSAKQADKMIMVDLNENQAYIINQLGQLVLKVNFDVLVDKNETAKFETGGDFTGYQYIRKYKNNKNSNLKWKFQVGTSQLNVTKSLSCDVSNLGKGWHHFCFVFSLDDSQANFYVDSVKVDSMILNQPLIYNYRTSLILGATTVKNTLLNNFLNIIEGYKMVGTVADLKMYSYGLSQGDVEQLYYSSVFSPRIKDLNWNMQVGYRNYVEEITEWFQFQLPTNKSKFYNINIHNLNVDNTLKYNIENALNNIIKKLSPAHTTLNKINWKTQ
jgi:hypothetical protein